MFRAIRFWWQAMIRGVAFLNSTAGWVGLVVLILGVAAGIAVPLVLPVSLWLTAVVLMGLLVVVVLVGTYRMWDEADRRAQDAEAALVAPAADSSDPAEATVIDGSGLEVVVDDEIQTPFPGTGLILEIEFHVTNHDAVPRPLSTAMTGGSFYFAPPGELDHEHARMEQAYGVISDRRERDRLPRRVLPGEKVRGAYVMKFAWDPTGRLPNYTLIIKDGRREYRARPLGADDGTPALPLRCRS